MAAQSQASVPPAPALISIIALKLSSSFLSVDLNSFSSSSSIIIDIAYQFLHQWLHRFPEIRAIYLSHRIFFDVFK
jgi:hypothetical protein